MNSTIDFDADSSFLRYPLGGLSSSYSSSSLLGMFAAAAYALFYLFGVINKSRKGKLPPGPKGVPFFGNLFQLSMDAWVPFTKWKYEFGIYLRHFTRSEYAY